MLSHWDIHSPSFNHFYWAKGLLVEKKRFRILEGGCSLSMGNLIPSTAYLHYHHNIVTSLLCVCVNTCICICMWLHMCSCMCGGPHVDVKWFPTAILHVIYWGRVSHQTWRSPVLAALASRCAPGMPCLPRWRPPSPEPRSTLRLLWQVPGLP